MKNYYIDGCIDTYKKLLELISEIQKEVDNNSTDSIILKALRGYLDVQIKVRTSLKDKTMYSNEITEGYREFLKIQKEIMEKSENKDLNK